MVKETVKYSMPVAIYFTICKIYTVQRDREKIAQCVSVSDRSINDSKCRTHLIPIYQ